MWSNLSYTQNLTGACKGFVYSVTAAVDDEFDLCPESNTDTTVVVDGCDSAVQNFIDADGCSISDIITEIAANASNHGNFVS